VVPLCRRGCHRADDAGQLDLVPYLEPASARAHLARTVGHVGLIGALRRISGSRSCEPLPESEAATAAGMIGAVTIGKSSTWTPEERAREARARNPGSARSPEDT
jgi:hypothetical protein